LETVRRLSSSAAGTGVDELANAAQLASLAMKTPEGRSNRYPGKEVWLEGAFHFRDAVCRIIAFSAQTRMSGVGYRWKKDPQRLSRCHRGIYGKDFAMEVQV